MTTAIFQAFFNLYQNKRNLSFQEKKEAYVGLLRALHEAGAKGAKEVGLEYAYWQTRCELISNAEIRRAIQEVIDTNGKRDERLKVLDRLKGLLRADLGISSKN